MDKEELFRLYEIKFDQIYRLNDIDWRYMVSLGALIAAFGVVFKIGEELPKFVWLLLFSLSFAGLVSLIINFRNMQLRLRIISNIERELGLYPNIIPPKLEYTEPKNFLDFVKRIMSSIRMGILVIYLVVMFFSIKKLDVLQHLQKIEFSIILSLISVFIILFFVLYQQSEKLKKEFSSEN